VANIVPTRVMKAMGLLELFLVLFYAH
jgi:hypothetical protein